MTGGNKNYEDSDIFSSEREAIENARKFLDSNSSSKEDLYNTLEQIIKDYTSTINRSAKLVRISDSTQRKLKKAQKELEEQNDRINKQNDELTQLNATKDKFFSIITHDLRNPITSVLLMSELVATSAGRFSNDELIEYVGRIFSSTKQLADLLDNLQRWSRTQTGKIELHKEKIKIDALIKAVVDLVGLQADNKSIKLIAEYPEGEIFVADRNMLMTILRNLISNAIKFSHENSTIHLRFHIRDGQTTFIVKDEGVGISPENLDKLFKIEGKVQTAGTKREAGTGLGLILASEFAKMHGGGIKAESSPGEGSVFTVYFPVLSTD